MANYFIKLIVFSHIDIPSYLQGHCGISYFTPHSYAMRYVRYSEGPSGSVD